MPNFFDPTQVDNYGTVNLVEACRKQNVNRFILISSILVNGAAMGQLLNPAYIFLNVFGLTLVAKLQAEQHIRKSGINYTIVRPGGLKNDPPKGNIVMEPEVVIVVRQQISLSNTVCMLVLYLLYCCRIRCMKGRYPEIRLQKLQWRLCCTRRLPTKLWRLLQEPKPLSDLLRICLVLSNKSKSFISF